MDSIDRSGPLLPAPLPSGAFQAAVPASASSRELANGASPAIDARLVLRGLNRHWWRILVLWLLLSAPLAGAIYTLIKPKYEAFSILQVEPATPELFGPSRADFGNGAQPSYLKTQVKLISSDTILEAALTSDARISRLPMIASSDDPKADLREAMTVDIVGNDTYLIRVALASTDAQEAAVLVNAVVQAYLDKHNDYHHNANKKFRESLEAEQGQLGKRIAVGREELRKLGQSGTLQFTKPQLNPDAVSDGGAGDKSVFGTVTPEQFNQTVTMLNACELERIQTQAELEAARAQLESIASNQPEAPQPQGPEFENQVKAEFYKDPDAADLIDRIKEATDQKKRAETAAVQPNDPARVATSQRLRELNEEWEELWAMRGDEIRARLLGPVHGDTSIADWRKTIADLEVKLNTLTMQRANLAGRLNDLKVETKAQNNDALSAAIVTQELTQLQGMQEMVQRKLEQLKFEEQQDVYRITLHDVAAVPKVPAQNKRLKMLAAAPAGVMVLMLGLFLLLEIKAERVADPDALSTRVQSEVYALPPLPTARSIRKRNGQEADDQIEQFIQRLDHLRFAVCGGPSELEKGRCVLITSAIGREGKTTLAAQFAARCGNAGISTLLIDADLRRTGLCSLLDVPEGPGLSDALTLDGPAVTDLVVPVQGGTFHLLPAGTPIADVSRALQGPKLGHLIGEFRRIYDLVVIDSPPVLPVPDALVLGQWADGAVIAARYDISRFPQVERARRQLDNAGIAVLGTVINGMRNSNSYYGSYRYGRRPAPQSDSAVTV